MRSTVHVVMPVLNGSAYVGEAIRSVQSQTFTDWNLTVVDDGSTDRTNEIVRGFAAEDSRIGLVTQPSNLGIPRAVNAALRKNQGEFFSFMGGDDRWLPGLLDSQLKYGRRPGASGIVVCDAWIIDSKGQRDGRRLSEMLHTPPEPGFGTPLAQLRRPHVSSIGILVPERLLRPHGFNENLPYFFDYYCWLSLSVHHRFQWNFEALCEYRIHGANVSLGHRRLDHEYPALANEMEQNPDFRSRRFRHWIHYLRLRAAQDAGDRKAAAVHLRRMFKELPLDHKNITQLSQFLLGEDFNIRVGRLLGQRMVRILQ